MPRILPLTLIPALLLSSLLFAQSPATTQPAPTTYCNPLPIPNYPLGKRARTVTPGGPTTGDALWLTDKADQFRELADITALFHEGQWILYPSVDMAWVSADNGATWQHHPLNIRDVGYAPTIVKHKNKFLLMASESDVYTADSPLGPFTAIGKIPTPRNLPTQIDPMLFSDTDGRLFFYWGCTPTEGIFGVELDPDNPTKLKGEPKKLIAFEPEKYPWQRLGDFNENPNTGWLEGAWMIKHNNTYYLTYCCAGTENRTYAVACNTSNSPLGPFTPQKNNPILRTTDGLVTGTSHGSFALGPNNALFAFYTLRAAVVHGFERRLGMDPAYFDDQGELCVQPASSAPMKLTHDAKGAVPTGWLPLNAHRQTAASSTAQNLSTRLAVDNDLRTWWQPDPADKTPAFTVSLTPASTTKAVRICWRDVGLNTPKGANAGPFQYKLELQTAPNTWTPILDRTNSKDDFLIDYRELPPTQATAARLTITGAPQGITPALAELTLFGEVEKR